MRRTVVMRVAVLAALSAVAACESSSVVGPRDFARLAEAEAQWKARPFADYSYEIRVLCFCPPEITQWTRVTVQGGVVTETESVDPNPIPINNVQYWDPIDSLFVDLRRTMTDPGSNVYLEAIIATYDPQLGYPTNIEYRAKPNVIDGGSQFSLRNVRPLN